MSNRVKGRGWPANVVMCRPTRIVCADLPKQPDADQPRAITVQANAGVLQPPVTEVG